MCCSKFHNIKIVLAILIVAIFVGFGVYYWQSPQKRLVDDSNGVVQSPVITSDLRVYSSDSYSLRYGKDYKIIEPIAPFPALNIEKAGNKRLEVFQMTDFPGGRPWGFTGEETQEEIDSYIPREQLTVGVGDKAYDVWLFYGANDNQTKAELHTIFDSLTIK